MIDINVKLLHGAFLSDIKFQFCVLLFAGCSSLFSTSDSTCKNNRRGIVQRGASILYTEGWRLQKGNVETRDHPLESREMP